MKVGTVLAMSTGYYVVTEIVNGSITETVPLEKFILNNTVIDYVGEYKTLREIVQLHCDNYLSGAEIIEEAVTSRKTKKI